MESIEKYQETCSILHDITGEAMKVHATIYWDNVQLDQTYRLDLLVNGRIIIELKAVSYVETSHRRQLWSYMNLTHIPYGFLINFGSEQLYTEYYHRNAQTGYITKMGLK